MKETKEAIETKETIEMKEARETKETREMDSSGKHYGYVPAVF